MLQPLRESPRRRTVVHVDGGSLSIDDVVAVARRGARVALTHSARKRMAVAREIVEDALSSSAPVYGLTTGVGERKRDVLVPAERRAFNRMLVSAHRVAQGPPAPPDVVRATMLCLANTYASGTSGVRPVLAELLCDALNDGFLPEIRSAGSVSVGDLGPMADLAYALLQRGGLELAEGEGLALLNSGAVSTAWGVLGLVDAARLLDGFDISAALDCEAFGANMDALHPAVAKARPYPGITLTLGRLWSLLEDSSLWDTTIPRRLQDPLTFRCVPQVHGAARDALRFAFAQLETELASGQGNPMVVLDERRIISVGNFDLQPISSALDFVRIALAPVLTSANERMMKILSAPFSGLPSGLAAREGLGEDALAELGVAGQALVIEARTLAQPVSYELASTTQAEGIEDRATMTLLSTRRLVEMVSLAERLQAIELLVAAQAIDIRGGGDRMGRGTGAVHRRLRQVAPALAPGEALYPDMEPVVELVRSGTIADLADVDEDTEHPA